MSLKKPAPPQRRKPEAILKTEVAGGRQPLGWAPEGNTRAKLDLSPPAKKNTQHAQRQPFDDDDDDDDDYYDYLDDDDDDDDTSMMWPAPSTGRPVPMPTGRPVVPLTRRPVALPTRRPVVVPTGRPVMPAGRPVVKFNARPPIPHAQGNNYMESLPAGCLLSDSLIACGSTGMSHLPIISDPGVRTLYLAGERARGGREE